LKSQLAQFKFPPSIRKDQTTKGNSNGTSGSPNALEISSEPKGILCCTGGSAALSK
jgi:hypothetical protein